MAAIRCFLFVIFLLVPFFSVVAQSWIRINQMGYLPKSSKTAVLVSKKETPPSRFSLHDALTDEEVYAANVTQLYGPYAAFKSGARLSFSDFEQAGAYYLKANETRSPVFRIDYDVYEGGTDILLEYMRQQRCGYNPFLEDSCHTHDGFRIYHPAGDSAHIDVTGGWHDATDYLQYTATSANAAYQLLFAYQQNPDSFGDTHNAAGMPGSNGIPDVLDEARWGIEWLMKMNPAPGELYNQIADDRDHAGYRLPNHDSVSYGKGRERPVYFITGEPQGLRYKNRANGKASTAGKFASAFALAADILGEDDPDLRTMLEQKARDAFAVGEVHPGVSQTAPGRAPYFYEEDNWVDDMELAAAQLYHLNGDEEWLQKAVSLGKQEIHTPWMGADTARHYQWYPFWNAGHARLAQLDNEYVSQEFLSHMRTGLEKIWKRGEDNPFLMGVPFIWCSNNLVTAAASQAHLYSQLSGDDAYLEMETALRDWLMGCNPWGISMVIGLAKGGDYPDRPHSSLAYLEGYKLTGGLIDGPVYGSIFNNLKGLTLVNEDAYAAFQSDLVVYHDDFGDYSTNEPTMDGTASLMYYLSALQQAGKEQSPDKKLSYSFGAINRTDRSSKEINLMFTGHEFAEGYRTVRKALKQHDVKASFFFTGDFYRNKEFGKMIRQLKEDGHYLGAHSDQHLLYASWEKRDSTLISQEVFRQDLLDNYEEMRRFGISKADANFFMPPYEWYNDTIAAWSQELGIRLVNFTPGTQSNQDWTYPELGEQYYPSEQLYKNILAHEEKEGLQGFNLLIHMGTDPRRKDKLYDRLDDLITELKQRGYKFTRIDQTAY